MPRTGENIYKRKDGRWEAIITNGISALEISTKLESLSEKVREQISGEFQKYGFTVANFYIQSINFPDEDFDKINKILEDKAAFIDHFKVLSRVWFQL